MEMKWKFTFFKEKAKVDKKEAVRKTDGSGISQERLSSFANYYHLIKTWMPVRFSIARTGRVLQMPSPP